MRCYETAESEIIGVERKRGKVPAHQGGSYACAAILLAAKIGLSDEQVNDEPDVASDTSEREAA